MIRRLTSVSIGLLMIFLSSCGEPAPEGDRARNVESAITFEGCSQEEGRTATTAWSDATSLAVDAKNYFDAGKAGVRYSTWFGTYDAARWTAVRSGVEKMHTALVSNVVTVNCSDPQCSPWSFGFNYPSEISPRRIVLCGAFWDAPPLGTDSRAGVVIHLLSTFTDTVTAQSYVYGTSAAQQLAVTNPANAIKNADNYEYFFENTPAIDDPAPSTTATTSTSTTQVAETQGSASSSITASAPSSTATTEIVSTVTSNSITSSTTPATTTTTASTPSTVPATTVTTETTSGSEQELPLAVKRAPSLSVETARKASVIRVAVAFTSESGARTFTVERKVGKKWQKLRPSFIADESKSIRVIDLRAGTYRVALSASGDFPVEVSEPVVLQR
jgi:hypothetical protein